VFAVELDEDVELFEDCDAPVEDEEAFPNFDEAL